MCGFLVSSEEVDQEKFEQALATIAVRGPDSTEVVNLYAEGSIGFHRLAIVDIRPEGNQPFHAKSSESYLVCNGEVFNHKEIRADYVTRYPFQSNSDCEVLLPLYAEYGIEFLCKQVDAEFAMVIYDGQLKEWVAARDPIGIRPLFFGYGKDSGEIYFASEVKALLGFCGDIHPFPPGHYYRDGQFTSYIESEQTNPKKEESEEEICGRIETLLTQAVEKRLSADVPVGFLLSGGLDSSLVCAIAAKKMSRPITTFAVGFEDQPIDVKYAREVADYIGSDHHEVLFSKADIDRVLKPLIYRLETFDITTIRASVGMYLLCEYISKETDIKVVLTGEVSDELFGYKYTDFAPNAEAFQQESLKRVRELYMYDVLRADRCISSNSLEARVPFADSEFVNYVLQIDPTQKLNHTGVGKYLLRKAFEGRELLPKSILYREKAAFSDAVGHGMVDYLKVLAEEAYSDAEFESVRFKYSHARPISKESLMYREVFEGFYPGQSHLISGFWMPNRNWKHCDVEDPSARVLPNYGLSGS